jgi:hypothetical protein
MNEAQRVYPVAHRMMLQALDDTRVFLPRCTQSKKVPISRTNDAPQGSGAFKVAEVVDPELPLV